MKKIKFIIIAIITTTFFGSCELNDESEISGHDITQSPTIFGWANSEATESYFSDQGTIEKSYTVKLLGGATGQALDKDVNYTVSVVADESTASSEFTLIDSEGVIPAGEKFAQFKVGINTGNFNPTTPTHVVFEISTTMNGVVVSSISKKMILNFVGCNSALEGNYTDVYGNNHAITKFDDVFYHVPYLPPFSSQYWFEFKDICGELTITNWQYEGSNHLTQNAPGYVDEDGNIIFPSITVDGVSWYVNRDEVKFFKN